MNLREQIKMIVCEVMTDSAMGSLAIDSILQLFAEREAVTEDNLTEEIHKARYPLYDKVNEEHRSEFHRYHKAEARKIAKHLLASFAFPVQPTAMGLEKVVKAIQGVFDAALHEQCLAAANAAYSALTANEKE